MIMDDIQKSMDEKCTAEGFLFYNEKDAELASLEQKKIIYLEERMDYSKPEKILQIYNKAVRDRVFATPVGILYLKRLEDYLLEQPSIDPAEVHPIPLLHSYDKDLRRKNHEAARKAGAPEPVKERKDRFTLSLILNILLGAAVIAMFIITLNSDNPNVLNYEKALTNRYASWEQELTEREAKVREKEMELSK